MKLFWSKVAVFTASLLLVSNCFADNFFTELVSSKLKVKVGEVITFGNYYLVDAQKMEPVEWRVLEVSDNKALLITEYGITSKPYNNKFEKITWAESDIRKWLNSDFYLTAFNTDERKRIADTFVVNSENPEYGTPGGVNTTDKIFLLSITEAQKYFKDDNARKLKPTPFAKMRGAWVSNDGYSCWWLRSPGSNHYFAAHVCNGGDVHYDGYGVERDNNAVRVALWLNL
jgi:hypothetical protein